MLNATISNGTSKAGKGVISISVVKQGVDGRNTHVQKEIPSHGKT